MDPAPAVMLAGGWMDPAPARYHGLRPFLSSCYSVPGPVQSRAPPPSPRRGQPPGAAGEPYRVRPQSPQPRVHSWPPAARHHRYCGSARCSTRVQFSTKKRLCQSTPLQTGYTPSFRNKRFTTPNLPPGWPAYAPRPNPPGRSPDTPAPSPSSHVPAPSAVRKRSSRCAGR